MPVHGLGWTLNYEMFFYALFAVSMAFSRVRAVVLCASILLIGIIIAAFTPLPLPLRFWFDSIVVEFIFGMTIALAYRSGVRLPMWLRLSVVVACITSMRRAS